MPFCGGYRFSRFELDLVRGCLREGDREIKLRPKAFVVLCHLVEQAGRLLSKDELMAAAWPGVHVSDGSLVQCIREIRRALDDDDQGCIKNVPGRGYLFAAPVALVELAPRPPLRVPRPEVVRPYRRVGVGVAVAVVFGAAIGVLAVRWLDGVPSAAPRAVLAAAEPTRQEPRESSSLADDVHARRQADDTQTELAYWQSVQASSDPRDFQSYLDQYPTGKFAALARNRLSALEDSARGRARQQAADAQRQADAQKAEAQRAAVAQRQAAELQRQTQAAEARRRADADRVAALEAEVKRIGVAAAGPPSPAPPPAPLAAPVPTASPQLALGAPARANLEGKWAGELGVWRFAITVRGGEISGSLSCGNNIYRLRDSFAAGRALDITANRVTGGPLFPTTISVKGEFPTLQLKPNSAPPPSCDHSQPFELRPVSAG
jgi:DNA-binding winged helix-turn-helix (wHTH) protein